MTKNEIKNVLDVQNSFMDVQFDFWMPKHCLDVQKLLLEVQKVFWTPKKFFWTSNKFVLDVQKYFWTSNKFFGRPKSVLDPGSLSSLEPTFQRPHYAQCLSDITAPPDSYDKKRNQTFFGRPKIAFDAQKNFLDVQKMFWTPKFCFGRPNNFLDAQKSFWTSKKYVRP